MKVLIAVPCMDECKSLFASSLAMLDCSSVHCIVAFQAGSLVYTSRNELAKKALEFNADYVLWLDSDIVFQADILTRMLKDIEGRDIITGLYFRRVRPFTPVLNKKLEMDEDGVVQFEDYEDYPDDIFEIAGCGFGCVLMRTPILFAVFSSYGAPFTPVPGMGEDLSFCWRARQLGYKIHCDPGIKLGHVGQQVISEDFYKAFRAANK